MHWSAGGGSIRRGLTLSQNQVASRLVVLKTVETPGWGGGDELRRLLRTKVLLRELVTDAIAYALGKVVPCASSGRDV